MEYDEDAWEPPEDEFHILMEKVGNKYRATLTGIGVWNLSGSPRRYGKTGLQAYSRLMRRNRRRHPDVHESNITWGF